MRTATIQMAAEAVKLSNALCVTMPNVLDYEDTKNYIEEYSKRLDEELEYLRQLYRGWERQPKLYGAPTTSEFNKLMKEIKDSRGIYFLFSLKKLVYIGQSTQPRKRLPTQIRKHLQKGRYIDTIGYFPVSDEDDLDLLERVMIAKHNPKFNGTHTIDPEKYEDYTPPVNPYELEHHTIFGDKHPLDKK